MKGEAYILRRTGSSVISLWHPACFADFTFLASRLEVAVGVLELSPRGREGRTSAMFQRTVPAPPQRPAPCAAFHVPRFTCQGPESGRVVRVQDPRTRRSRRQMPRLRCPARLPRPSHAMLRRRRLLDKALFSVSVSIMCVYITYYAYKCRIYRNVSVTPAALKMDFIM